MHIYIYIYINKYIYFNSYISNITNYCQFLGVSLTLSLHPLILTLGLSPTLTLNFVTIKATFFSKKSCIYQ